MSGRVTASPLDPRFAAYGALIAAVLALVGVMALLFKSRYSVLLLWIFNILGFIDFLVAVALGLRYTHPAEMGATYFIPILAVPSSKYGYAQSTASRKSDT